MRINWFVRFSTWWHNRFWLFLLAGISRFSVGVLSLQVILISLATFLVAVFMTMAGRGGGNFYVILQVLAGASMGLAASTGQFLMFSTAFAAMFIFSKHKTVSWPMAVFIGLTTSLMAFVGGVSASSFSGTSLKLIFSFMLVVASIFMLFPVRERKGDLPSGLGFWRIRYDGEEYVINFWVALPVALATGFVAGMVGVSGGSFLIPLMVLGCRLPMHVAVGTASVMVAATALMGFLGHLASGGVDLSWVLPQAVMAILGGLIGSRLALKTKPRFLKLVFAVTTMVAAGLMFFNAMAG